MKTLTVFFAAAGLALTSSAPMAADVKAGEATFNSKGCSGCHGPAGRSVIKENPVLAGKDATYIEKQLNDFKSGARQNATMNTFAPQLTPDDVKNVAAYLSAQK